MKLTRLLAGLLFLPVAACGTSHAASPPSWRAQVHAQLAAQDRATAAFTSEIQTEFSHGTVLFTTAGAQADVFAAALARSDAALAKISVPPAVHTDVELLIAEQTFQIDALRTLKSQNALSASSWMVSYQTIRRNATNAAARLAAA